MELNEAQQAAVHANDSDILAMAGAGTGKTSTLVARAQRLLTEGVPANRIVLITFTRRAAAEMRTRLQDKVGAACNGMFIGTFHKFCIAWMKRHPKVFGLDQSRIANDDEINTLWKMAHGEIVGQMQKALKVRIKAANTTLNGKGMTAEQAQAKLDSLKQFPKPGQIGDWFSYYRAKPNRDGTYWAVDEYLEHYGFAQGETATIVASITNRYTQLKEQYGYLDYDDLLSIFQQTLFSNDKFRQRVQSEYDHLMVDEFQDTNPVQWLIVEAIRDPVKLFAVGDARQACYSFRGADFRNVYDFKKRLTGATVIELTKNYRSTDGVTNLANWVLEQSSLDYGAGLESHRGQGAKPQLRKFDSAYDEAEWIASDIATRRGSGDKYADHMCIVRRGFDGRILEGELIRRDIPYQVIGGRSLLQAAHVRDLLSAVTSSRDHTDRLALMRFLTMFPKVGNVTANRFIDRMEEAPDSMAAYAILAEKPELEPASRILQSLHVLMDVPSIINKAVSVMEPILADAYDDYSKRARDFTVLKELATKYDDIMDFIEDYILEGVTVSEAEQGSNDKVTIITVHSSKGTECKTVYLVNAVRGRFPDEKSCMDPDDLEEERRILYIALTRAMDNLILCVPEPQWHQEVGEDTPYFLEAIPKELIEVGGVTSQPKPAAPWKNHKALPDWLKV